MSDGWPGIISRLLSTDEKRTLSGVVETHAPIGLRDLLGFLLAEWQSLRAESQSALDRRNQVVTWGTAGLAAVIAAAGQLRDYLLVEYWLLITAPAIFSGVMAVLWLGEGMRAGRAGAYMAEVEQLFYSVLSNHFASRTDTAARDLLQLLSNPNSDTDGVKRGVTPSWESFLRRPDAAGKTSQILYPYYVQATYFFLASTIPIVFAVVIASRAHWTWQMVFLVPGIFSGIVALYFLSLWRYSKRIP